MTRQHRNGLLIYLVFDFLTAMLAWTLFFLYRKVSMENNAFDWALLMDPNFYLGIILIPFGWLFLYAIFDSYQDIYRISRMATFFKTILISFLGVIAIFFALLLDDWIYGYQAHYHSVITLFFLHFFLTILARMTILTIASNQLKRGEVGFNTLIIGGNANAVGLFEEINSSKKSLGYRFLGFIDTNGNSTNELAGHLTKLGKIDDITKVVRERDVEEVILAIETSEHNRLKEILNKLAEFDLVIKIIPDMYDIMLGSVKMSHIYGAILIEIYPGVMTTWQRFIKRTMDITASFLGLLVLSPLLMYIMLRVRNSSPGPIFYSQERIGRNGNPFTIYKFRSMYVNAEDQGPQLSQDNDNRCTAWGAIMRKWRLDELPQFWNVIKGDMSLVGPRPERQYYIDLITEQAPHYKQLLRVRPGITSWGQVKYGYASNVEEMVQRLRYDILYVENFSLLLDIKIMLYTVLTLIQGRGK